MRHGRSSIPTGLLLCESCGYDLDHTRPDTASTTVADPDAACPECGRPIASSIPDHRIGSAWQRGPSIPAWFGTLGALLRHPRRSWDQVRVEARRSRLLLLTNTFLAALLAFAIACTPPRPLGRSILHEAAWAVLLVVAILFMTWIENRGIRFFGGKRGWRISKTVAHAVCGHASFGWILAGIGAGLAYRLALPAAGSVILSAKLVVIEPEHVIGAAGMFPGLLVFETTVFLGVRDMRYANGARGEP